MHELGYSYLGDNSIYDLTVIEMDQLREGQKLDNKRREILSDPERSMEDWIKYRNTLVKERS